MTAQPPDPHPSDPTIPIAADPVTRALHVIPTGLARLAFAESGSRDAPGTFASRHLALLPPDALELDLGDPEQRRFGDYELLEKIGQGGMGVVYRARQHSLDREVALKLLAAGPWASGEFVERFKREAQSAARMQHPNIVAIYEIASREHINFFSMRLVHGPSLAQVLAKDGAYAPNDAARLLRKIAEALDYAHRLGVLHLDLKPHNVLLDELGEPQVADFGLARRLDESFSADADEVSGTPSYMAPEQAQLKSHKLSPATDIYGLGAILYELLSGAPPFRGATPQDTLERVVRDQVPALRTRARPLPSDLEAICLKCLAKSPSERYASARELADDLGRFLDGRAVSVRRLNAPQRIGRWARREPRVAAAVCAFVLALVVGLVATSLQWRRADANARIARTNLWEQRHETAWRLFQFPETQLYQAQSLFAANLREQIAAGDKLAETDERRRLAVVQAQVPALLDAFSVGAQIHVLAISPDARYMALGLQPYTVALYDTNTRKQLWRVRLRLHSGEEGDGQLRRLQFTPDGRYLLVSRHWSMLQMRPGGLHMWRLALADGTQTVVPGADHVSGETWSDDGHQVLLLDTDLRYYQLYDTATWRPLSPLVGDAPMKQFRPGWLIAPGLRFVAMHSRPDEGVRILDPATLKTRFTIAPVGKSERFIAWAASPDGRTLALAGNNGELLLADPENGKTRSLAQALFEQPTWLSFSADGTRMAVSMAGGDFFVYALPGGQMQYDQLRPAGVWGHQLDCDPVADSCTALLMEFDRVTMWQWAGHTDNSTNALAGNSVQLAPEISHNSFVPRFASAFDLKRRFLVTGGQDGSLKLWRLPESPLRSALAAPQAEDVLRFDGHHLVGVEGREVWVQDADTHAPLSPRMRLPQPVGFAFLGSDGRDLVACGGHVLHVFDWRSGRDRIAPVELGDTPTGMLPAADGHTLVVRWTDADASGAPLSRLQAFDLRSGRPLGRVGVMPYAEGELSADGNRLLVSTGESSALYSIADLSHPLRRFPAPDKRHQVGHASFRPGGDEIVQFVSGDDNIANALQYWSLDGRLLQSQPTMAGAHSLIVRGSDGRVGIIGDRGGNATVYTVSQLMDRDGTRHAVALPRLTEMMSAQALSADGRVLAQATDDGALLVDMNAGRAMGPPLRFPMNISERIARLAFSGDGDRLLARTSYGRWLLWNLTPDRRDPNLVAADSAQTAPEQGTPFVSPSPALRASWLERDHVTAIAMPRWTVWSCMPPGGAIPPRAADTPPNLLDLGARFTTPLRQPLFATTNNRERHLGDLCALPLGVQRFLGTDYDVRGIVELQAGKDDSQGGADARSDRLALDSVPGRYARVHVLGAITSKSNAPDGVVGQLRLIYSDGGSRELPLRMDGEDDDTAAHSRLAWIGLLGEGVDRALLAADLANPEPERELIGIELRVTAEMVNGGNLSIVAITLDPAGDADP